MENRTEGHISIVSEVPDGEKDRRAHLNWTEGLISIVSEVPDVEKDRKTQFNCV